MVDPNARPDGARDSVRDVAEGLGGAAIMAVAMMTPFMQGARSHWGLDGEEARRPRLGDDLVPEPSWSWTHAVEIASSAEEVWPWVAQLGADRAGFYSYQWLENLAGCNLRNAEAVHADCRRMLLGIRERAEASQERSTDATTARSE